MNLKKAIAIMVGVKWHLIVVLIEEWLKKMGYILMLFTIKNEGNLVICDKTDGP